MKLVVNTNILFSFFNEKSKARELATSPYLELHAPIFALGEINEHEKEILIKFSLTKTQFLLILKLLQTVVNFVETGEYAHLLSKAKEISPDQDDIDFFALALKLGCGIWSNDDKLSKQPFVKVISTAELIRFLSETT